MKNPDALQARAKALRLHCLVQACRTEPGPLWPLPEGIPPRYRMGRSDSPQTGGEFRKT